MIDVERIAALCEGATGMRSRLRDEITPKPGTDVMVSGTARWMV